LDSSLQEVGEVGAVRTIGVSELVGVFTKLKGIEGIAETGETDDVKRGSREPGEYSDICLTRLRRGGYLLHFFFSCIYNHHISFESADNAIRTSADLETNASVISRMWLLLKAGFWTPEVRESTKYATIKAADHHMTLRRRYHQYRRSKISVRNTVPESGGLLLEMEHVERSFRMLEVCVWADLRQPIGLQQW